MHNHAIHCVVVVISNDRRNHSPGIKLMRRMMILARRRGSTFFNSYVHHFTCKATLGAQAQPQNDDGEGALVLAVQHCAQCGQDIDNDTPIKFTSGVLIVHSAFRRPHALHALPGNVRLCVFQQCVPIGGRVSSSEHLAKHRVSIGRAAISA